MSKLLKSFAYAFNGIKWVIRFEQNFRIHIIAAILACLLGWVCHISVIEWIILIVIIGGVMGAEAMNTAIEKLCDVVSSGYNEKIKIIKDLAAAAVLLLSISALIVGAIIFLPKLTDLFFGR